MVFREGQMYVGSLILAQCLAVRMQVVKWGWKLDFSCCSYQEMLKVLPESLRESVVLQIIPLPTILDHKAETEPRGGRSDVLRSLALSVYAQNQRRLPAREPPKMLTGFGPATAFKQWLEERKARDSFAYTPPYVLS